MSRIKLILIPLFIIIFGSSVSGEDKLSASTKRLLTRIEDGLHKANLQLPSGLVEEFLIHQSGGRYKVRALIMVNSKIDRGELSNLGITINSELDRIWTVDIPLESIRDIADLGGIEYLEIDTPVSTTLDSARTEIGVDKVHAGLGLSQAFKGEGIILGIIDSGFDFTHPSFMDQSGQVLRVSRVWDQAQVSGTPPTPFSYGSEYVGSDDILAATHDTKAGVLSHGSHVAGIAGGSGYGTAGLYSGIAPEAELVFVSVTGGSSSIVDGINYIFSYAQSVGRPAVVNLSLGSHYGPHDGTSLLDQTFDQLVGPGKLIVGAAGNEGDDPIHFSHNFAGDTIRTVVEFEQNQGPDFETMVEIWGAPNSDFSVAVAVFDSTTGSFLEESQFFTASSSALGSFNLYQDGDQTVDFHIAANPSYPSNQKPNIQLELTHNCEEPVVIIITAENNTVHMWNTEGTAFSNINRPAIFQQGNSDFTVGEVGGTSESVISVGAYTTKNRWDNFSGSTYLTSSTYGDIASFSSHGPTTDDRLKPDIAAPGNVVASAVSSVDASLIDPRTVAIVDNTWRYYVLQGTSMATPVVAGVVALMVQSNPGLTKSAIVDILQSTGRQDQFTGSISESGSNIWGHGKIDAYAAVIQAAASTPVEEPSAAVPADYSLDNNYPNPFNPSTTISFNLSSQQKGFLKIFDISGREVATLIEGSIEKGEHSLTFDGVQLASGVYFYRLKTASFDRTKKMVLLK